MQVGDEENDIFEKCWKKPIFYYEIKSKVESFCYKDNKSTTKYANHLKSIKKVLELLDVQLVSRMD